MSATMSDIANRAGTSIAAVSVTLNGAKSKTLKVSPETRQRILNVAEELGYRRNPLAGALATGRSRILGLMLPHAWAYADHDPFYSLVTTGVTACAARYGYNVMLYSAAAEDEGDRAAKMIDKLISGLIFVSPPAETPLYAECRRLRIPYVTILAGLESGPLTVNSADYEGGLLATRHLIARGHKRIAHLAGRIDVTTSAPRQQGYLAALKEAGISPDTELCIAGDFNRSSGYESTRQLMSLPLDLRPTAIFAANDLSAHGAIEAVIDSGLDVPNDVAVVGYDDTWYATVTRPTLTSVRMDVPSVGRHAAELLISFLEGDDSIQPHRTLPVSLTIRESCGASRRT